MQPSLIRRSLVAATSALAPFLQAQPATDASAWQVLASAWGAVVPAGADACAAALDSAVTLRALRGGATR